MSVHTETYKGYDITICHDDIPTNPRTEWDNLTKMICFHGSYTLGDKDHGYRTEDFESWDAMVKQIKKDRGPCTIQPLYLYEHGGITISTGAFSCAWDSGQVGFVLVTHKELKDNWPDLKGRGLSKKAKEVIEQEVKTYDDYLRGLVYGYEITDAKGEQVDSCFGFLGDYEEYCLPEAKQAADWWAKEDERKRQGKLKTLIKNKVPLNIRAELVGA